MKAGIRFFADKDPGFVAFAGPDGDEWSRGRLDRITNRMTRAYRHAGLREGDSIAVIAPNCVEFVIAYLAGIQAGLSVVPVNWHLAEDEIAYLLHDAAVRAVVAHAGLGSNLLGLVAARKPDGCVLVSIGAAPGYVPLDEFVGEHSPEPVDWPATGHILPYTSATTGRPKAVLLPKADRDEVLKHIVRANAFFGIHPEDNNVHLCASMLYHSAPLMGVDVALQMGHKVVLSGRWEPEPLLRLIDTHRVTTTFMVPSMFIRLLKLPSEIRKRYSVASLRFVTHGAAPCPQEVKRRMLEWWGPVIWESYGATEAQGTIASAEEWLRYPGTVGKPFSGVIVKILDEHGNELPPGEVGLVYLKPTFGGLFEYKGDPEKTRGTRQGEFVTVGDLGYLNEDGYLFLRDRSADLILSAGANIYPAEIETLLIEHPHVVDCAVVGQPHHLLGSVPKAYVQAEPSVATGRALTAELLKYLSERLSAIKLPTRIEYVERIPRDPNGKLFKRLLGSAAAPPENANRPQGE